MRALPNPYLQDVKIGVPALFCGRDGELRAAYRAIQEDELGCVAVMGERHSGKSSLLKQIASPAGQEGRLEQPERFLFLYSELQQTKDCDEADLWSSLTQALVHCPGDASSAMDAGASDRDALYRQVCELVDVTAAEGQRIVLLLDGLDAAMEHPPATGECLARLWRLVDGHGVHVIASTTRSLTDPLHSFSFASSPLGSAFAQRLVLGPLDVPGAAEFVVKPSRDAGCCLEQDFDFICHLSGHLPVLLQHVCRTCFDKRLELGRVRDQALRDEDLDAVEQSAYESALPFLEDIWDGYTPEARSLLRRAAAGDRRRLGTSPCRASLLSGGALDERGEPRSELLRRFVRDRGGGRRLLSRLLG